MGKKNSPLLVLTFTGIFGAACYLVTFFLGIPYAGGAGYFSFGDAIALLASYLFGPIVGLGSALIGAIFADLAKGYAMFIPFSVLAKTVMIMASWGFSRLIKGKAGLLGFFVGGLLMPLGYLPIYLWLYGDYAFISLGFDFIQGIGSALVALIAYLPLSKAIAPLR